MHPTQKPSSTWAMAGMVLRSLPDRCGHSLYMCAGVRIVRSTIESMFVSLYRNDIAHSNRMKYPVRRVAIRFPDVLVLHGQGNDSGSA